MNRVALRCMHIVDMLSVGLRDAAAAGFYADKRAELGMDEFFKWVLDDVEPRVLSYAQAIDHAETLTADELMNEALIYLGSE